MTTRTIPTLADLIRCGELDGFAPRAPRNPLGLTDDFPDVIRASTCPNCGHVGLTYRPFTSPTQYRVMGVCPTCDTAEEF